MLTLASGVLLMRIPLLLLSVILIASISCSRSTVVENAGQQNANNAAALPTPSDPTVLFTIPVGDNGIQYADEDATELEPWGPSSFTIAPDGTYLIVDPVGNKILRFKRDGTQLPTIPIETAGAITDVTASADNIYALDQTGPSPALYRLTNEGRVEEKIELMRPAGPRSRAELDSLTGIGTAQDNSVFLEYKSGAPARSLNNAPALDRAFGGNRFVARVPPLQTQVQEGGKATVRRNDQAFTEIKVDNLVAEVRILGVNAAGDVFVVVDEIIPTAVVNIDETVRHYRADGTFVDVARVPVRDMYSYWAENVRLDPTNGDVVAIVTRKNNTALVKRLEFKPQLDAILPKTTFTPSAPATTAPPSCRTRTQMIETAKLYYNNRIQLSADNLDGNCSGRTKPRYLRAAGLYTSVPYDWGGFDTVVEFRNAMSAGMQAGDVQTCRTGNCVEPCSHGVDCSGFVSRVWGSGHEQTSTLPNISDEVNILELRPGDILNLPNRHVVVFERFGDDLQANGTRVFEATTSDKYDRVINRQTNWRRWLGYTARRYRRVCAG